MIKPGGIVKPVTVVLVVFATAVTVSIAPVQARKGLDYRTMVDEIGGFFHEALSQYRKGNIREAKEKAQAAYLEVFENLEGPIRINVSAKKNYELEQEFIAIRQMIAAKEPVEAIEKRMNDFMAELRSVTAKLEGGVELVAEASDEMQEQGVPGGKGGTENIEPVWLQAFENIRAGLGNALGAYKKGDSNKAAELVLQTQFDHYKNSLLETAVRRYVSQKNDYKNNSAFSEIIEMILSGTSPERVGAQVSRLIQGLREDLPGLPLIEGAVSARAARKSVPDNVPEKDWSKVTGDILGEMDKALALYKKGEAKNAVLLMQDAYFDLFEASAMEAKIGAKDPNFKAALEGHFSLIVGQMKKGVSVEEMESSLAAMRRDFEKAASMLGKGGDSPIALFFYSLMIILREGIEAILIITTIIVYLLKTGNQGRLRVICHGCITALVLSVVTAVLVKWVFKASAASQEVMEGATMLLAAAVLFSVSYWLIAKAEAQKWISYIKDKVGGSLSTNSMRALWFAAFLAVYREGAETVLFYQALASDLTGSGLTAAGGGFVLGCGLLVGIYLGMRYGAVRLPIRPFFLVTGALLYYMSFVFTGKGVMELIEGKIFEPSLISWMPTIPFAGVYPYVQTLLPQVFIILAGAFALGVMVKRRVAPAKEESRES